MEVSVVNPLNLKNDNNNNNENPNKNITNSSFCKSCLDCGLKSFLFLLMIGPCIVIACLLIVIGIIGNLFTLYYFILFGWMCKVGLCDYCGKVSVKGFKASWKPLIKFSEMIFIFFKEPLIE